MDSLLSHRLVSCYFPSPGRVFSLLDWLCVKPDTLFEDGDHQSFRDLLSFSLVAVESVPHPWKGPLHSPYDGESFIEVIRHAQWFLLTSPSKSNDPSKGSKKPRNVLTLGYKTDKGELVNVFPNTNVAHVEQSLDLHMLLQRVGRAALTHLLTRTSFFLPLPNNCYLQVAGIPLSELPVPLNAKLTQIFKAPLSRGSDEQKTTKRSAEPQMEYSRKKMKNNSHRANDICFLRNQMFHAHPCRDKSGSIVSGFSMSHVLNESKLAHGPLDERARYILKCFFPRQYGIQSFNATSGVDRGSEIKNLGAVKTPNCLKGITPLVKQLLETHSRLNYRSLLDRHCPRRLGKKPADFTELDKTSIMELLWEGEPRTQFSHNDFSLEISRPSLVVRHGHNDAKKAMKLKPRFSNFMIETHEVESFVKAVLTAIFSVEWWGSASNWLVLWSWIKIFISARRHETFTLHALLQKFKIKDMRWWAQESENRKVSRTDALKQTELLQDLFFWIVNDFLIHLLKTTFYITESSAFRNRTLYFRQDDWHDICQPLLEGLSTSIFQRIPDDKLQDVLANRTLGYSSIRLLPKETGVRPIANLKRRIPTSQPGRQGPRPSINFLLQNAFQILTYEKTVNPHIIGSSVFGANEIYRKLKEYKRRCYIPAAKPLYFVKVDIKSCFDTIKQEKLLEIIRPLLSEETYMILKYGVILPASGKISRKFQRQGCPDYKHDSFHMIARDIAEGLQHAIFVDSVIYPFQDSSHVYQLLSEHVSENVVKIGNHFYYQRDGIPQGSVLSTLLCSIFYGDMEKKTLSFVDYKLDLLLRYTDDFLFITPEFDRAKQFLCKMHHGQPEYGCSISLDKTLVNFPFELDGQPVPIILDGGMPWCGYMISTTDLSVQADYKRYSGFHLSDTLTVEFCRKPGEAFNYRMLQSIKSRAHIIFNDTAHNGHTRVLQNVFQNFILTAMKFSRYLRIWKARIFQKEDWLQDVIEQCCHFSFVVIRNRANTKIAKDCGAVCSITQKEVAWLGKYAFVQVLSRHPQKFAMLVKRLRKDLRKRGGKHLRLTLDKVISQSRNADIWQIRF